MAAAVSAVARVSRPHLCLVLASTACWACCRSPPSVPRELAVWTPGGVEPWRLGVALTVLAVACVTAFWADAILRAALPARRHGGLLVLLLPISVSGFGVPQGVIVWLLRPVGVADAAAFALSTLIVLTGLAGNLPGLALWLRRPPLPATGA